MKLPSIKQKFPLRLYLIFVISLILIFSTLTLLLVPAALYKKQYYEQAQNYCKNMIIQTATGIHSSLQQFDIISDELLADETFTALFDKNLDSSTRIYQYQNIIRQYFPHTNILDYYIQGIDLYMKDPSLHLKYGAKSVILDNPFSSAYYTSALSAPLSLNWNGSEGLDTLVISRIVYDFQTYEVTGLMIINISIEFLKDKFNIYNTMEIDNFFIIDGNGIILCSDNADLVGSTYPDYQTAFTEAIGTLDSTEQITVYCKSKQVTFQYPYQNWNIVINLKKERLFHDFNAILRLFYLIAFLIILIGIWISIKFSQKVTRPIQELSEKMAQVQEGNLQVQVYHNTSIQELSFVNHVFNTMAQRLDTLINTVYRIELAQKEAQFNALQAQINPHFLFNTMQLLYWKADEYEAYPVCDMIQSLCYMLETTLNYRSERTFSLREEMEYLKHYAKILHYKYLDKISLQFQIPEELLECQIPVLAFQPFIENSVVHGLEPMPGEGYVLMTASREGDNLVVTISDNGVGIQPDTLNRLNENFHVPPADPARKNSYQMALHNVQTRIRLLYGEAYGYTIESHLYNGTRVTVTIPYQTQKEVLNYAQTADR